MIRNGLTYRHSLDYADEWVLLYAPTHPFTVDGILYVPDPNLDCHRPMIEVFDDVTGLYATPQSPSRPPTDTELDEWVLQGRLQ